MKSSCCRRRISRMISQSKHTLKMCCHTRGDEDWQKVRKRISA
nr:MAG TPA: Protein of unknown function (DUF1654) [Caudoviricetes sp.]